LNLCGRPLSAVATAQLRAARRGANFSATQDPPNIPKIESRLNCVRGQRTSTVSVEVFTFP
jgi:hypothetical protein